MTDRNLDRAAHIWTVALAHDIDIEIGGSGSAWRRTRREAARIRIPPIRGQVSYLVALHELGHILGHGSGLVRLEEEALAWKWALASTEEDLSLATLRSIRRRLESYLARAVRRQRMTLPGDGSEFQSLLALLVEVTS